MSFSEDTTQRRATRDIGIYVSRMQAMRGAVATWYEAKSLVRSIKILGASVNKRFLRANYLTWKMATGAVGQGLTERTSIRAILEVFDYSGRENAKCELSSGVTRWISVDTIMGSHRSAAKMMTWLREHEPNDPRLTNSSKMAGLTNSSKMAGLRSLEERAKEVQEKHALRSRSRRSSPVKGDKSRPGLAKSKDCTESRDHTSKNLEDVEKT